LETAAKFVFLIASLAGGCRHASVQNPQDTIRAALQQHLSQQGNLNLAAMDMNIENVTVNGNRAQAQVQFRLHENNVTMEMLYMLEEHGGSWIVTHSQPAGGQFSHPPMDKTHSMQAQ
jgi:hypothetical protein